MSFKDIRIKPEHLYITGTICFFLVATIGILNVIFNNSDFNALTRWTPVIMSVFYYCLSAFFFSLYRDIPKSQGKQLNQEEIRDYFKNG